MSTGTKGSWDERKRAHDEIKVAVRRDLKRDGMDDRAAERRATELADQAAEIHDRTH